MQPKSSANLVHRARTTSDGVGVDWIVDIPRGNIGRKGTRRGRGSPTGEHLRLGESPDGARGIYAERLTARQSHQRAPKFNTEESGKGWQRVSLLSLPSSLLAVPHSACGCAPVTCGAGGLRPPEHHRADGSGHRLRRGPSHTLRRPRLLRRAHVCARPRYTGREKGCLLPNAISYSSPDPAALCSYATVIVEDVTGGGQLEILAATLGGPVHLLATHAPAMPGHNWSVPSLCMRAYPTPGTAYDGNRGTPLSHPQHPLLIFALRGLSYGPKVGESAQTAGVHRPNDGRMAGRAG